MRPSNSSVTLDEEETRFYLTQEQAESVHFVVDGQMMCPPGCKGHETDKAGALEAFAIEAANKIYQASRVETHRLIMTVECSSICIMGTPEQRRRAGACVGCGTPSSLDKAHWVHRDLCIACGNAADQEAVLEWTK